MEHSGSGVGGVDVAGAVAPSTNSPIRTMLVYGATGKTGRLVVERALTQGWAVSVLVRNPDKVPDTLRSNVTIVRGDLTDALAVAAAVRSCRPNAIVDASSALPFGHAKGQPANNANRALFLPATVEALEQDGRLNDCVLLIVGGQLFPEPGETINSWSYAAIAWLLRTLVARQAWREAEGVVSWLFEGSPAAFRFVYARMGRMVEEQSHGTLHAEATQNNIQHGSASFIDVAEALVQLAGDQERKWERKALFFNYH